MGAYGVFSLLFSDPSGDETQQASGLLQENSGVDNCGCLSWQSQDSQENTVLDF